VKNRRRGPIHRAQIRALASEDRGAATRKFSRQAMRKFLSETKPCVVVDGENLGLGGARRRLFERRSTERRVDRVRQRRPPNP
jgi:hypothetical protein